MLLGEDVIGGAILAGPPTSPTFVWTEVCSENQKTPWIEYQVSETTIKRCDHAD
jgi:hypothetical protein